MNFGNPFTMVPLRARRWVYGVFSIAGLVAALINVGYNSAGIADPIWLTIAGDILEYLIVPVGLLAASNTPASTEEILEVVDDVIDGEI